MSIVRLSQILYVDNYSTLPTAAQLGDYAFVQDTKTYFCFNGVTWKPMGSANPAPPTVVTGSGAGTGATTLLEGSNTDGLITLTQASVESLAARS